MPSHYDSGASVLRQRPLSLNHRPPPPSLFADIHTSYHPDFRFPLHTTGTRRKRQRFIMISPVPNEQSSFDNQEPEQDEDEQYQNRQHKNLPIRDSSLDLISSLFSTSLANVAPYDASLCSLKVTEGSNAGPAATVPVSLPAQPSTEPPCTSDCPATCDKDDCTDDCEYDDCGECSDGCLIEVEICDEKECIEGTGSDRDCHGTPCPDADVCHETIICQKDDCSEDQKCSENSCMGNYCHDESCQEKGCEEDICHSSCQSNCPVDDYAHSVLGTPQVSAFVSAQTNNTIGWSPSACQSHAPYSNVEPTLLNLDAQSHSQQLSYPLSRSPSSFFENPHGDYENSYQHYSGPSKRRRVSTPMTPSYGPYPTHHSTPDAAFNESVHQLSCLWNDGCDMRFMDNNSLANHINNSHIDYDAEPVCLWSGCRQEVQDHEVLLDHVKDFHMPHVYQTVCLWRGCSAVFQNDADLQSHLRTHLEGPAEHCLWGLCNTEAHGIDDLEEHLHNEHFITPHDIPEPDAEADPSSSEARLCEWLEVNEDGSFHVCGKTFSNAINLQQHAKDCHIAALRKKTGYFCFWEGCNRRDKPFSQKGKVERHIQTHTGYKSCTCPFCQKEFSAPQALQQHIRTHTGEKPYKCNICGKEFAQGSAMTMHKRVHTGERPLQCDFPGCGKRFSESSNLSKHRKSKFSSSTWR
ncbi:hypothetical protein L873DRAFT_1698526 [Choiromyces venosus 120613-1]|uniref:C2H2-type domain-containing protein n=1 Tax=Choiromyces venosus 120613-1 TaxID=1336337 RepID=A0A3N4JAP3_9PEZI|nr:hypothetical protein L873DRAFT_1698526 [Choiromyces venosus 120613-1]